MTLRAMLVDVERVVHDTLVARTLAWDVVLTAMELNVPAIRIEVEIARGSTDLPAEILGAPAPDDGLELAHVHCLTAAFKQFPLEIRGGAEALIAAAQDAGLHVVFLARSGETGEPVGAPSVLASRGCTTITGATSESWQSLLHRALVQLGLTALECMHLASSPASLRAGVDLGVVGIAVGSDLPERELRLAGARAVYATPARAVAYFDELLDRANAVRVPLDTPSVARWMDEAIGVAREAVRVKEAPAGCVLVRGSDGKILARGHNSAARLQDKSAHGEIVAFRDAFGKMKLDARDVIMVSTLEPCVMCTGLAMETGTDVVIYGLEAPTDGGTMRVYPPTSPEAQMPRVLGGVKRDECRAVFADYMAKYDDGESVQSKYIAQLLDATNQPPARPG